MILVLVLFRIENIICYELCVYQEGRLDELIEYEEPLVSLVPCWLADVGANKYTKHNGDYIL